MTESTSATSENSSSGSPIPAGTFIGHVHLKVSNLDRAVWFYHEVMGFDLLFKLPKAAFLSAGGYHHHLGLNTWESMDGEPPAPGTTGLYHFAINYPTRKDLAGALKRLLDHRWSIGGASDHTTHEAIYLHDPDRNGIELACDRDRSYWHVMVNASATSMEQLRKPLDFDGLLGELGDPTTDQYLAALRNYR